MPLSLSHLAEDIFGQMINESRAAFIQVAGLESEADQEFIRAAELASCEARFEPVHVRAFNGACRVDVAVRLRSSARPLFQKITEQETAKSWWRKNWQNLNPFTLALPALCFLAWCLLFVTKKLD